MISQLNALKEVMKFIKGVQLAKQTCEELVKDEPVMCTMNLVEDCYCPEGMVRFD